MASTDSGPLGDMAFVSIVGVDPNATGTDKWVRVRVTLDRTSATEAITGFTVWHDDETGSTTPVWISAPTALKGGDGDSDTPTTYEFLVIVPFTTGSLATWWETFKEYPSGAAGTMDKGGVRWSGAAVHGAAV